MPEKNNTKSEKRDLILGDDFEKALVSAAEVKNTNLSLCKERNKNNYSQFYELMLGSRVDIQEKMAHKGRAKTEQDKEDIKNFKKDVSQTYKQVCDMLTPEEDLEEGELTKVQKMVQKITKVVKILKYIDSDIIEKEFEKDGISLKYKTLEDENDMFLQTNIKDEIKHIFDNGKNIREDINRNNEEIKTNIYENSVPIDLQYDRSQNPTGLKPSDFCKLVDLKAKVLKAQDDEAKEKIRETAENIAGDYIFQNERNTLMNSKIIEISA